LLFFKYCYIKKFELEIRKEIASKESPNK